MCISNNAYAEPRIGFGETVELGAALPNGERLIGYYNKVTVKGAPFDSRSTDFGWEFPEAEANGNCMILALPAEWDSIRLIPISKYPSLFLDLAQAVKPPPPMTRMGRSVESKSAGPVVIKNFDGLYDVVKSPNAMAIASVIDQVDRSKRPLSSEALWADLDTIYGNEFVYLLFCFSEEDSGKAGGVLVRYKTHKKWEHLLHLPALDGHNGAIERGEVELNHTLAVSAPGLEGHPNSKLVRYSEFNVVDEIEGLPLTVIGKHISGFSQQGDFLFSVKDIASGTFRAKRQLPPKWEMLPGAQRPQSVIFE